MIKSLWVFLLLVLGFTAFGQKPLPTISSGSRTVHVRVGSDYDGEWFLEPENMPDVFSIGSKWPYDSLPVSFITDQDTISFAVRAGEEYDFVILLDKAPCRIRVVTSPDPAFLRAGVLVPLGVLLIIMASLIAWKWSRIRARHLLGLGYATPFLFWLAVGISGWIHGGYDHSRNTISELGAVGSSSEIVTSTSFVFIACLASLFSIALYKASKELELSVIPSLFTFSFPVSLLWAAIFPQGNELHGLAGPLPLFVYLASLLAFLLWPKEESYTRLRTASWVSFLVMMFVLLRFIGPIGNYYEGLVQRFFYAGWTVWTVSLSYLLQKRIKRDDSASHL